MPDDVKQRKWDQLGAKEKERVARIQFRAEQLLKMSQLPPRQQQAQQAAAKANTSTTTTTHGANALVISATGAPPSSKQRAASAAAERRRVQKELHSLNPNFTFQPSVAPTVPDFEHRWAKMRAELASKRLS